MDKPVEVYIEIEKDSNEKFEYNHTTKRLELDRILPDPYFYPFPYGFFTNTKGKDNDELDVLIITNKKVFKDTYHHVRIIGVLIMEDEQGMDEKILTVFEDEYKSINSLSSLSEETKKKIHDFFSNYKKQSDGRWSKVYGYKDKEDAIKIYKDSLI